jgi:hypothetical protein
MSKKRQQQLPPAGAKIVWPAPEDDPEQCPDDAHEGCGGPWWHELTLEERALVAPHGGGPWWAEAALEEVGAPVFEVPTVCSEEGCGNDPLADALEKLEEAGSEILEVAEYVRAFVEQKPYARPPKEIAAMLYDLARELEDRDLVGFLDQLVTPTFPNRAE